MSGVVFYDKVDMSTALLWFKVTSDIRQLERWLEILNVALDPDIIVGIVLFTGSSWKIYI